MEDVYAAFSEHLRRTQAGEVSVLDEEDGLLVRWSAICEERYVGTLLQRPRLSLRSQRAPGPPKLLLLDES